MLEFLEKNIQWIIMTGGIVVAWFVGKKDLLKSKVKLSQVEIEAQEIENVTSNFKVYQDLITDLEDRFKSRIDDLELDLEKFKDLNLELRKIIANQERYNKKLQTKLDKYEKLEEEN